MAARQNKLLMIAPFSLHEYETAYPDLVDRLDTLRCDNSTRRAIRGKEQQNKTNLQSGPTVWTNNDRLA
jgi:hypothetical protein